MQKKILLRLPKADTIVRFGVLLLKLIFWIAVLLVELIAIGGCSTIRQTGTKTETITTIKPKQINVQVKDSLHIPGERLHVGGITVHVDSTGVPVLEKQTIKQGRTTATVAVVAGKLQLDVKTADSNIVYTRTIPVRYNDTQTNTKTTVTQEQVKTRLGKILSGLASIPLYLVIIAAVLLCYTLFKRAK